ncbi:glycosyltransferase family 4 protein [Aurantibacter sp.]|uniref:glycosyltransferase family 4 protein n=1 Tax=Aurantibacter sp. TaxID=2807103 RepID=UPI0032650372
MNQKKVLISQPYGNTFVRGLLPSLENAGILGKYYTLMATKPDAPWLKLMPNSVKSELLRRTFPIDADKIETSVYQTVEIGRKLLNQFGLRGKDYELIQYINQNFDKSISNKLETILTKENIGSVYAYEDIALKTFKKAKTLGLKCVYDLPIAYWEHARKFQQEEAERYPEWAITLKGGIDDPEDKLKRKAEEIELADLTVVPSQFVKDSVPNWVPREKILISPFGTPENLPILKTNAAHNKKENKLRVLFVGSMSQRKGLGDLFAAIKILNNPQVELVVLGSLLAPMKFYRDQCPDFVYEPGRPHAEVLELMRTCDVFCLPSIIEGRALVMQEAMSQGLPLIITPNTGGDDLIEEEKTGFLVPIRSPEIIADKINWFLENSERLPQMSNLAQQKAIEYTWASYGSKIVSAIKELTP